MNSLITNKLISNLFIFGIFLFAGSLLVPENYRNLVLILFALVFVLTAKKSFKYFKVQILLIQLLPYIIVVMSILYTQDFEYGIKRILVLSSMLVFPLAFCTYPKYQRFINKNILFKVYKIFYLSTLIFFIGVFIHNYFNDHFNEFIFRDYSERLNSKYGKYSLHPIYASIYIGVSLLFSFKFYYGLRSKTQKTIVILGNILLAGILLILARKGVILILLLIFTFLFTRTKKPLTILLYSTILLVFIAVSYFIPEIRDRYTELVNVFSKSGLEDLGSTSYRLNIYRCDLDLILKNPILGYGLGDTKTELTNCFLENDLVVDRMYYNSHNQYFSFWLASGILGFLSLAGMLVYNLRLLIKNKLIVESAITILFIGVMLIENILERQSGVMLFSFFINFFVFVVLNNKKRKEN